MLKLILFNWIKFNMQLIRIIRAKLWIILILQRVLVFWIIKWRVDRQVELAQVGLMEERILSELLSLLKLTIFFKYVFIPVQNSFICFFSLLDLIF